jgi:pantoate--beta-alanine ligase
MSAAERAKAPELFASLQEVSDGLHRAPATALELERLTTEKLHQSGWKVDYVAVRKQADLQPPGRGEIVPGARLVVLAAARLGSMRLIDNLEVNLPD